MDISNDPLDNPLTIFRNTPTGDSNTSISSKYFYLVFVISVNCLNKIVHKHLGLLSFKVQKQEEAVVPLGT